MFLRPSFLHYLLIKAREANREPENRKEKKKKKGKQQQLFPLNNKSRQFFPVDTDIIDPIAKG
jgi:hypothetical protein